MALRFVEWREPISPSSPRFTRDRLSRCRWQTARSSVSWLFTSLISLFLAIMKFISPLASASSESKRADSDLACSHCPHSPRHRSFSAESCFTFSRISFSILRFSSSLEAMWNCSSWQSFSLLAISPLLMEMAVSSSEILASMPAFSSSTCESVSVRFVSSRIRLRRQFWVLWVRSERSSACPRSRLFSRFPFSTSSRSCPTCRRVRSCSIPRTSSRFCCSCTRSRASAVSSSRRSASSAHCCAPNFASRSAATLSFSSSPSCSACHLNSCTLRTVSSSRSWLLATLVSWSLSSPSWRARALASSSLTRSQRSWVEARASRSVFSVAMMAFLWSRLAWQSQRTGRRLALLPFLSRLIFQYSKIINFAFCAISRQIKIRIARVGVEAPAKNGDTLILKS